MKIVQLFTCIFIVAFSVTSPATAEQNAAASISQSAVLKLDKDAYKQSLQQYKPDVLKQLVGQKNQQLQYALRLHSNTALSQLAVADGLAEQPRIQSLLQDARRNILVTAYLEQIERDIEKPNLTALAEERYLATRKEYTIPEKRRAAHIMMTELSLCPCDVASAEENIREIHGRLMLGADFAELAKESHDLKRRNNGGEMNTLFEQTGRETAFETAVFALKKVGDISEPFKSKQGWHVMKLTEIQASRIPEFSEVQAQLEKLVWRDLKHSKLERARGNQYPEPDKIDVIAINEVIEELLAESKSQDSKEGE